MYAALLLILFLLFQIGIWNTFSSSQSNPRFWVVVFGVTCLGFALNPSFISIGVHQLLELSNWTLHILSGRPEVSDPIHNTDFMVLTFITAGLVMYALVGAVFLLRFFASRKDDFGCSVESNQQPDSVDS